VVVFAKEPRAGLVKTRLVPPLSPELAAGLYAAMLDDVLETTAAAAPELGLEPVLAVHPANAAASMAARAPAAYRVIAQCGEDLGARMAHAVAEAAAGGFDPILLRGSDSPAVPAQTLRDAVEELSEADLVVSPDRDGGYNLVGVHRPIAGLFSHKMSVTSTLDELLQHAARRNLRAERLAAGFDVDTIGDLAALSAARSERPSISCPRTLAFLDDHELWRHVPGGS